MHFLNILLVLMYHVLNIGMPLTIFLPFLNNRPLGMNHAFLHKLGYQS